MIYGILYTVLRGLKTNSITSGSMTSIKIISWNVNGLQSILKRNVNGDKVQGGNVKKMVGANILSRLIADENPDILCLQEIRCSLKFDHAKFLPDEYKYQYVNYATTRKGYSGVMVITKLQPLSVAYNFGSILNDKGLDNEGRVITLEYDDFYIINVYTPNSGVRGLHRLAWRINTWDVKFRAYVTDLSKIKNVIVIGDLNVIHTTLDCYRSPIPHIAGGTIDERNSFEKLLAAGFVDAFRLIYANVKKFTWVYGVERKNGFRLDYALVNGNFKIYDCDVLDYKGSDHLPIFIELATY